MHIKIKSRSGSWWRAALAAVLMSIGAGTSHAQENGRTWIVLGEGFSQPPAVRAAQYLLREHGHTVSVDGVYGSQTRERVRRFQKARGLGESGIVSDTTWERLIVPVRRGSRGNAVRAVQSLLRALDAKDYRVTLDGVFSAQTERAVRRFQKAREIPADGLVGPVTWHEMVSIAGES